MALGFFSSYENFLHFSCYGLRFQSDVNGKVFDLWRKRSDVMTGLDLKRKMIL